MADDDQDGQEFERELDVAVEFMERSVKARLEGHEPPDYHKVERQVNRRRREDRNIEKNWRPK